jgi:hypothetical protein
MRGFLLFMPRARKQMQKSPADSPAGENFIYEYEQIIIF